MSLTADQRMAGHHFRTSQFARLVHGLPPVAAKCSPFIREYRHDCPSRGGVSWPLQLKEKTELSPEYWVCYCSEIAPLEEYVFPHKDCQGGREVTPAGFFSYAWLEGHCKCGLTVRSGTGRLEIRG